MFRRMLAMLCTVALLVTMAPVSAFAEWGGVLTLLP